ncbi:hypothetical protein V5097_14410 [Arenibacter palladensis]|uniref:hypothetical protein n=1 Tax=Arenibacter palladensis TaxID=237373 RepID=UPI002FD198B0
MKKKILRNPLKLKNAKNKISILMGRNGAAIEYPGKISNCPVIRSSITTMGSAKIGRQ